jgi:hypothetical protein
VIHVEIRSLQVDTVADAGSVNIGSTLNIINQREEAEAPPGQPRRRREKEIQPEEPTPPVTQPPVPPQPGPPSSPPAGGRND